MQSQEIRRKFLNYFREKTHTVVPSSPVVPHDDPTLLFINAGMNQFKDVFLGKSRRDYTKAVSSQKCIRVGGKHNDLENVGHTRRHLTFFEMLGNFSFGDYFKEDAIRFAWEVSTQIFGFDPARIWPTVFKEDDEAFELWTTYVPAERITRMDAKTNFWAMGDTGPCGPCSELLYDRGPSYGTGRTPLEDLEETRFLEFWNLVFMQFNRDEGGSMLPLPKPSIDTGAGLERVVNLKMNVDSVYDTDVLHSIIRKVEEISCVPYLKDQEDKAAPFRVIADHLRCLAFAIADGVQPSNVDRGYVLRKVLRRAVRYGRTLKIERPFLADVLPALIETMGEDYPELLKSQNRIVEILTSEEEAFIRTLRRGGNILNSVIEKAQEGQRKITGDEAFKLKDTYGFPLEEILLLAKDASLGVDIKRYAELEGEAKERSRSVHKTVRQTASENLFAEFAKTDEGSKFIGYDELASEGKVKALLIEGAFVQELPEGKEGMVILDRTPFYAEMGGQVGDTGELQGEHSRFQVTDAQSPYKGVIAHLGKALKGNMKVGDFVFAKVDVARRQIIANNHTATHLLHWSLCRVLGEHVKQAGSVVDEHRLRFDFTHHKALTKEEIRRIEDQVNEKIRENTHVSWYELPYEEVTLRDDIKQFFGEKYDKVVRVLDIDYSKELCGGTHTAQTGNIGLFRIAKEGSIAAGVRRIEAVTGPAAEVIQREEEDFILKLADKLKVQPQALMSRLEKLIEENKTLNDSLKELKGLQISTIVGDLFRTMEVVNGIPLLSASFDLSPEDLKTLGDETMKKLNSGVLIIGSAKENVCQLIVRVTDDLVKQGINAKEIIAKLAPVIQGGGGGKANSAQAGGKAPEKLGDAIIKAKELLST